ncbi:hypothetical protein [Nonomuraea sp. NPDC046570]|uniref:hypothetical protein n=1 Tax=Nonomuraea sp. NPDC046570 TaxID=3155255 RepID=UPI0034023B06
MNDNQGSIPTTAARNTAPTVVSGGTRPGLLVTPALFGGAMAAVVVMVFVVLFLVTREAEPARAVPPPKASVPVETETASEPTTPGEQEPAAEPEPTGAARFTKDVEPCPLVGEELTKKLVLFPQQSQIYKEECEWSLTGKVMLPDNMTHNLKVYVKVFGEGVGKAHEQFLARRQEASLLPRTFTPLVPPVGDASYSTLYSMTGGTNQGPTTATVGIRTSNALIEVEYQRRVPADPTGRLTRGATEVAVAVAKAVESAG